MGHKAERRPGSGEIWLALTKYDGVQVDSILIDQAKFGEALRQVRASNFDLPVALGLQLADRGLKIILQHSIATLITPHAVSQSARRTRSLVKVLNHCTGIGSRLLT